MRALGDACDEHKNGFEYQEAQLDKATGHIYRAAYDTLDGMCITIKRRVVEHMKGCSNEAIAAVLPDYYTQYLDDLNSINDRVAGYRESKDIGQRSMEQLEEYLGYMAKLRGIEKNIALKVPAMVEYDSKEAQKETRSDTKQWLKLIFAAVLAAFLTYAFLR